MRLTRVCVVFLLFVYGVESGIQGQVLQFEKVFHPFPLERANGQAYMRPFLGGYNTPRIQWADRNGDGIPDLLLQEHDDQVTLFINTGSRETPDLLWVNDDAFGVNVGAWFRLVDMDDDGVEELFCAGENNTIRLYRADALGFDEITGMLKDSDGNAILSELTSIPAFFDIDCDGDKDMFLGRQNGTITFYENTGGFKNNIPQFRFVMDRWQDIEIIGASPADKSGNARHGANSLTFGDLNGDGAAELIYGDFFSQSLYFFNNTGNCDSTHLERAMDTYPPAGPIISSGFNVPSLIDLDNDGDLDLFVTVLGGAFSFSQSSANNFYYVENFGTPDEAEHIVLTDNYLDLFDTGVESVPAIADIDGDGDADCIIGNQAEPEASSTHGQALVFENMGSVQQPRWRFNPDIIIDTENIYNCAPELYDLDNDGDTDLLLGKNNGKLAFYENRGTAAAPDFVLTSSKYMDIDVGSVSIPRLADWDGDGDADLCIGEFDGSLNFYLNTGDSSHAQFEAENVLISGYRAHGGSYPAFYDWDQDGDPDLLVGYADGSIHFYRCTPTQDTLFHWVDSLRITASRKVAPIMLDWDRDGMPDILAGTQGGGLIALRAKDASLVKYKSPVHNTSGFSLSSGRPNPFNGRVHFRLNVALQTVLTLSIYDVRGKRIRRIMPSTAFPKGNYTLQWDGLDDSGHAVSSGVYWLVAQGKNESSHSKIVYLK